MIFRTNKYSRWYFDIVQIATNEQRKKSKDVYYERHHIVPKSLGGDNSKENLVLLTAREHFICHWLLTKMVSGSDQYHKMACALNNMTWNCPKHDRQFSSRHYEIARTIFGKSMTAKNKGRKHNKDTIAKMCRSRKTYYFIDPDGNEVITSDIRTFCSENNLTYTIMSSLHNGNYYKSSYRGWFKNPTTSPSAS